MNFEKVPKYKKENSLFDFRNDGGRSGIYPEGSRDGEVGETGGKSKTYQGRRDPETGMTRLKDLTLQERRGER